MDVKKVYKILDNLPNAIRRLWEVKNLDDFILEYNTLSHTNDTFSIHFFASYYDNEQNIKTFNVELKFMGYGLFYNSYPALLKTAHINENEDIETIITCALIWFVWATYQYIKDIDKAMYSLIELSNQQTVLVTPNLNNGSISTKIKW